MRYRYSHQKLKQELQNMTAMEHVPYVVEAVGIPAYEAEALVKFILDPYRPQSEERKQDSTNNLADALQRCNAMIQKARQDKLQGLVYENPLVRHWSPFEKDVLHIRYMLGRESIYDAASRHNPNFSVTKLVNDIDAQYVTGHAKPMLLLCGGTGCGKTFAALSKVCQLARVEFDFLGKLKYSNAAFVTAKELATMIQAKQFGKIKELREAGVLIIDDLGTEPIGFKGSDFNSEFEGIIDFRHKFRKQTIMTTNLDPRSDDENAVTFAKQYGERVLSRIKEIGVVIGSDIEDMRGKQ